MKISDLFAKLPKEYYVCEKKLWCGDIGVNIDHIDDDLSNPLNYEKAILKMLAQLAEATQ